MSVLVGGGGCSQAWGESGLSFLNLHLEVPVP